MNKETYPEPRTHLKLASSGGTSEHDFSGTLEDWEERIFRNAHHFNVVRFGHVEGGECCTTPDFAEAIYIAHSNPRSVLYAVTLAGRAFCMAKKDYEKFARIYLEGRG